MWEATTSPTKEVNKATIVGKTKEGVQMNTTREIIEILEKRKREIELELPRLEKALKNTPEGCLRISKKKKGVEYYHVHEKMEKVKYLSKNKEPELIMQLAQKGYNQNAILDLKIEIQKINALLEAYKSNNIDTVYEAYIPERKKLVEPVALSEEEFAKRWQQQPYIKKKFDENDISNHYTEKNERVRSKSEIIIANLLRYHNIPYKYECPLALKYNPYGRDVYPDFTILNKRNRKIYYLEHLGMMDDEEYIRKAFERIMIYEKNGIILGKNLVITYETSKSTLDVRTVEKIIAEFLI